MLSKKCYVFALLLVVILYSCGKSSSTTYNQTCPYVPPTVVAPASEVTYLQNYLSNRSIIAKKDSSGIFYNIDSVGNDTIVPTVCSAINFSYVGNLLLADNSNPQFDAGTISYYLGNLIVGWQLGIPLIRKGGSITLYIPPTLGYGNTAQGTAIPANSYLKFKIQLLGVQ